MPTSPASPLTSPSPSGLLAVEHDIAQACQDARRERSSVTLIAVSKTFAADAITPVIEAGQRVFGENRVQEAKGKWPEMMSAHSGIALHLIGPLQSNKVKEAVALFDVIQTLDRAKLADALAAERQKSGRCPRLFLQVNTGEEPQKAGVLPRETAVLIAHARKLELPLEGLMCIPPVDDDAAPHFAFLAKLARDHDLAHLSMGMSDDFELAVKFGATHVRVGTAIFGARLEQ
jgi:pyridoxal phosphate enzyme (YggS family)